MENEPSPGPTPVPDESTPTPTGTPTETATETPTETATETATPDEEAEIPWSDEYGTVVNLVEHGADPTGGETIRPLLEKYSGDDTLLYLPSGRYLVDDIWHAKSFEKLGIYGDGATIVPPTGYSESPLLLLGSFDGARDLSVQGLHFDFTKPGTGPSPMFAFVDDKLHVKDISVSGSCRMTRFEIMEPDGEGVVENVHLPDGGYVPEFPPACYISEYNRGTVTLKNFRIANFPNNGIYASGSEGPVHVVGGVFENNDISNVRVGDNGSVRDVTVKCNDSGDDVRNMRGIWVKGQGVTVENCDVQITDQLISDGAIVLNNSTTIRDSRFVVDSDNTAAILGLDISKNGERAGHGATTSVESVEIKGTAASGAAVTMINHDGCSFNSISIHQTGADRHAFEFFNVSDAVIRNASVNVTGNTIIRHKSSIKMLDL